MNALHDGLRKIRAEIAGNRRLALGLAAIVCILVLQAFLMLLDLRAEQARAYQQKVATLEKMKSLAGEQVWIQRAAVAARLLRSLQAEIPQAETAGVAQAQLVTWARDVARTTEAEGLRIQPGTPEPVASQSCSMSNVGCWSATACTSLAYCVSLSNGMLTRIPSQPSSISRRAALTRSSEVGADAPPMTGTFPATRLSTVRTISSRSTALSFPTSAAMAGTRNPDTSAPSA